MPVNPTPPFRSKTESEDRLNRAIGWSALIHAALFSGIILKSLVFPSTPEKYIPSLRVDLVALPDKIRTQPPVAPKPVEEPPEVKAPPPPPKKAEIADRDEMVLKPKKTEKAPPKKNTKKLVKKNSDALKRLKALSKIRSRVSEDKEAESEQIKGNQISLGTSTSADAVESMEASYFDQLRDQIQHNWDLPVWIARQNYSAQIKIFIDSRGIMRSFTFIKSSGNEQFDEAVKKALNQSQPFPEPPNDLQDSLMSRGISLGFPI